MVRIALVLSVLIVAAACAPAATPVPPPTNPPAVAPTSAPAVVPTVAPAATTAPVAQPAKDPYKSITPAQDAWAKAAQVGPYAPAKMDWDAIKAAAVKEGKVVVYSNSSRWSDVQKTFEAQYPGVKVEGYDISTGDLLTKVKKEQQAGIFTADVYFVGDPATQLGEMFYPPNKMIWTFLPDVLLPNVKAVDIIDVSNRDPVLVHHYSNSVFIYNNEVYKEMPVKNIWDMTKPEWKGRITLNDPQTDSGGSNCMVTMTQHPDEMAKAYEAAFGKPIKLDPGVPNAGYQWIKDFEKNQPIMTSSGGDVATNVGTKGQKNPPLGLASWSKIRNAESMGGKLAFDIMFGLQPVMGCYDQALVSMANLAPHPNAAKLLIQWYMGDDKGGLGNAPYNLPGDHSPRKDVPVPKGGRSLEETAKLQWRNDPVFVYDNAIKIRDFWISNLTAK